MPKSLGQLLTESDLRAIIHRFYEAVYGDPLLSPIFARVDRRVQEERLLGFVQLTAATPTESFEGPFLRDAHAHLRLSEALFAHRHGLLVGAVRACGHGEEVVEAWNVYDARWRRWVVEEGALVRSADAPETTNS